MSVVSVNDLKMTFRTPVREEGLGAAIGSVFRRQYRDVESVRGISFELNAGEVVGFIGPNGAGKTTTLKILSGILHPTAGDVRVLGFVPWKRESAYLRRIAMIRGSQPIGGPGELTVMDALRFQQLIYEVHQDEFRRNLQELTAMLDLAPLLQRQIRALSLGERMRTGLALALLYRPRVLFLDEPTIGLDVSAVGTVRRFIRSYSAETGATILLTSHYMADVETLCRRIVLIDRGSLRYDGDLAGLSRTLSPYKLVKVAAVSNMDGDWKRFGEVVAIEDGTVFLRVHREDVPRVTTVLLAELTVTDLSIEEPPLESVIDRAYQEGIA